MLSKYSVKRPYTVLVGVLIVIVLGVVSLMRMTADLFPNMNLPYVLIITTDIGASPEEVEKGVTAPLEASMATTSSIKEIRSMSYNSYSVVILEYEQASKMESTLIEIQQNIDQLKGSFADTVGTPIVMQIDPDMMPVMMAAVDVEGMDNIEAGDYVKNEIVPQLESVDGVASVNVSGGVEQKVVVTLNEKKIDAINKKIIAELDKKFEDAEKELADAENEMQSGKDALKDGENQLADTISQTTTDLNTKKLELYKTEADLNSQLADLNTTATVLSTAIDVLNIANETSVNLQNEIDNLKKLLELYEGGTIDIDAFIQGAGIDPEEARAALAKLEEEYNKNMEEVRAKLDSLTIFGIDMSEITDLPTAIAKLSDLLIDVNMGIATINEALNQINAGKLTIDQALVTLNKSEILSAIQMGSAEAQLATGEAAMDQAKETFDSTKESAYDQANLTNVLTVDTVKGLLLAQNFDMPAGYITDGETKYLVKVGETIDSTESLENLVLIDLGMDGIDTIKLNDVADVEIVDNADEVYAKVNGNAAIIISFEKQTGYSTGDVTDAILDKFDVIKANEDENVNFTTLMDQGVYIDIIVKSVLQNMIIGAVLAIIVLIIFLKDFRPTIIISCAIPLSVVCAIVLMYFSNITLNIISMSGLALGIGMLVDNSIVVIENIYRLLNTGMSIKKAAVYGASQVTGAIIASTLTTICVFAPIIFTEGLTRQLFVDMALTIAFTLCSSLVVALTLVPAMAAGIMKNSQVKRQPFLDKFLDWYGNILTKLLKWKPVVFIVVIALLGASIGAALSNGTAFIPDVNMSDQISITITPPEDANWDFSEMCAAADDIATKILEIEEVDTVGCNAGGGSTLSLLGSGSDDSVSMYVLLKDGAKISSEEINKKIMDAAADSECEISISTTMIDLSSLTGSGVSIRIEGRDIETLQNIAADMGGILTDIEGIEEVDNGLGEMTDEFIVNVDREKAAAYGLTVAQVFQLVYGEMASDTVATTISTSVKDFDVYLQTEDQSEATLDDIRNITFTYTNSDGEEEEIPITAIADFSETQELSTINRTNQNRCITVSGTLKDGYNVGLVGAKVENALKDYEVPEGYSFEFTGADESINEAMGQLMLMLLLAVILIYLIMVAQFQSLLSPFIIMFTIPLAFTGGFFALYFTGKEVSVIAMVGFVMLAGIIVNNGIVMVDYINQLRREGAAKKDAIVEAAKTRLRPVLMTTLTTVISMSTMALGMGDGTEMMQPMAIVSVGGLIYGTLLTLIVVPCIYDAFNRDKSMVEENLELSEEELSALN